MNLWIDDLRTPPAPHWVWAKTSAEALHHINNHRIVCVSFDHDLGGEDTAYAAAVRIEELCAAGSITCPIWHVHSANPVGRNRIMQAMMSAERLSAANEDPNE